METIFQHFTKEEQPFVKMVVSLLGDVLQNNQVKTTSFLSIREQEIVKIIIGKKANLVFDGGHDAAERKIAIISQYEIKSTRQLVIVQLKYNSKFSNLSHGSILGTLVASGIERNVIGDIIVGEKTAYVVVISRMLTYLQQNISTIGKTTVELLPVDAIMEQKAESFREKTVFLKSLRIDALLANALGFSREVAKEHIKQRLVQKNWTSITSYSEAFSFDDVISVRRYGRIYIDTVIAVKNNSKFKVSIRLTK
jgi:Uncharacterized conserved protein, contains S4-like domain